MKNEVCPVDSAHPFPPSPRDVTGGAPVPVLRPSAIAYHEAGHCLARRFLGMALGGATIIAGRDFGGLTYGPGGDGEKVSAASIRDDAELLCAKVLAWRPAPGETRDKYGFWLAFIQSQMIETLAGRQAETLAGYDPLDEAVSTDVAIAKLYAEVLCISDGAAEAFIDYCSIEARELLKMHLRALQAVASALQERETLDCEAIDRIILEAEAGIELEKEKRRRQEMAGMVVRATDFHTRARQ